MGDGGLGVELRGWAWIGLGYFAAALRRLLRVAHPDHGGVVDAAAERMAELREAGMKYSFPDVPDSAS